MTDDDVYGGGASGVYRVELDPIARMRVLTAGISGAHVAEGVLPGPVDVVWPVMVDFAGAFARFQTDMHQVSLEERDGEQVTALARSRFGMRARLHGVVRPGWCWLQSRFLVIGMAAAPGHEGVTRVALTGGVRIPGRPALVPGARRELERSLERLRTLVP